MGNGPFICPPEDITEANSQSIRKRLIPDAFFPTGTKQVSLRADAPDLPARGANEPHLVLVYGGGFLHWGYFVGSPTFRMSPGRNSMLAIEKMADGVYRFTER